MFKFIIDILWKGDGYCFDLLLVCLFVLYCLIQFSTVVNVS